MIGLHVEQFAGVVNQQGLRREDVALIGEVAQRVDHAGRHARGRIVRQAQIVRDLVGGLEADAVDVLRQTIGIGLHQIDRGVAVLLVDFDGEAGVDAVALQKQHHLLDRFLFVPGAGDGGGALGADAQHLADALRRMIEHVQRFQAKALDDARGGDRADAFDQAGAEIFLEPFDRGGQHLLALFGFELLAVLRVGDPLALQAQRFAGGDFRQRADDGDEISAGMPRALRRRTV